MGLLAVLGPRHVGAILGLALLALAGLAPGFAFAQGGDASLGSGPALEAGGGIVARPLTSGSLRDSASSTAVTATVTIGANKLALVWVAQRDGTSGAPTLTDHSRSWEVVTSTFASLQRLTLYRSMNSADTSSAITITSPIATPMVWTLVEYGNVDTTGRNGAGAIAQFEATNFKQTGVGMTTYASSVLTPALQGGSASVGGFVVNQKAHSLVPGKGYTFTGGRPCATVCIQAEFRGKFSRLVDLRWTNNSHWLVAAVELKRRS